MFGDLSESDEFRSTGAIRIGAGGARMERVTQQQIEYVALPGERYTIDLEECARNWVRWHRDHSGEFVSITESQSEVDDWNAHCVGTRGACDNPPWVQLMDARRTRFEFDSYEAVYQELLGPLSRYGWHTFDTN